MWGLLRDDSGRWLGGFAKFLGRCNSFMAVLWELFEGIKLVISLGVQNIEINLDSLSMVHAIDKGNSNVRD